MGGQDGEQGKEGLGMVQVCDIHCPLYVYHCHMVTRNEIIIQLSIMQDQWEPPACFPAPRRSHLGLMGDPGRADVNTDEAS